MPPDFFWQMMNPSIMAFLYLHASNCVSDVTNGRSRNRYEGYGI